MENKMRFGLVSCLLVAVISGGTSTLLTTRFTTMEGNMTCISAGPAGVWALNGEGKIFYREGTYGNDGTTGSGWTEVSGGLKQLDVGTDIVWAVNSRNKVYVREGISSSTPSGIRWAAVSGGLSYVSVSDKGHVWAVNSGGTVYRRVGASLANPKGDSWEQITGNLVKISVGQAGVWGIDSDDVLFYRTGTYGDPDTTGTEWEHIDGKMKYISSGTEVWGVDPYVSYVSRRYGLSASNPSGTRWESMWMTLGSVDVGPNSVWGLGAVTPRVLARLL